MNKPVNCGCGGEAIIYINGARQAKIYCEKCGIESNVFATKYEAIAAWNRAMGERTIKVKKSPVECFNEAYVIISGYCDCGALVFNDERNKYCPHCGARLEWK